MRAPLAFDRYFKPQVSNATLELDLDFLGFDLQFRIILLLAQLLELVVGFCVWNNALVVIDVV